jgi:hypothetical protein
MPPIPKQRSKKPATKPPVVKRVPTKKGSLAAINVAATAAPVAGDEHAREVFDEMPERYVSLFLSGKLCSFAVSLSVRAVRCSQGTDSFVGLLNEASIDIDEEPLGDYENDNIGVNDAEDVEEAEGDDDDELEEVDAGTYEDATSKKISRYKKDNKLHRGGR